MTPEEKKEILQKNVNYLEMLISAAKQRGDINEATRLFEQLQDTKIKIEDINKY